MRGILGAHVTCEERNGAEAAARLAGRVGRASPGDSRLRPDAGLAVLQGRAGKGPKTGLGGPQLESDGPADGKVIGDQMNHDDTSSGQGRATVLSRSVSTLA